MIARDVFVEEFAVSLTAKRSAAADADRTSRPYASSSQTPDERDQCGAVYRRQLVASDFMVTAPLRWSGSARIAPGKCAVSKKSTEPFVVHVDKNEQYFINDDPDPIGTLQEIRVKADIVMRNSPETEFLVRADKSVRYDAVVQAMVLLQQAGVPGVGLVTDSLDN